MTVNGDVVRNEIIAADMTGPSRVDALAGVVIPVGTGQRALQPLAIRTRNSIPPRRLHGQLIQHHCTTPPTTSMRASTRRYARVSGAMVPRICFVVITCSAIRGENVRRLVGVAAGAGA